MAGLLIALATEASAAGSGLGRGDCSVRLMVMDVKNGLLDLMAIGFSITFAMLATEGVKKGVVRCGGPARFVRAFAYRDKSPFTFWMFVIAYYAVSIFWIALLLVLFIQAHVEN